MAGRAARPAPSEVEENIRVLIRPRPFLQREVGEEEVLHRISDNTAVVEKGTWQGQFNFDHIFEKFGSQTSVYSQVSEFVDEVLHGINCSIFAYGQTGTGKTYTMLGLDELSGAEGRLVEMDKPAESEDRRGLIPRAICCLFGQIEEAKGKMEYRLFCSYVEIYNERIFDLLQVGKKRELSIHEDKQRGVYIHDVKEVLVQAPEEIFELMKMGQTKRAVSTTAMNDRSSRSHTIFQLFVEGRNLENETVQRAKLNLVDLAGSEKWDVGQHNYVADPKEIKELTNINQSLSALGNCVAALSQKGRSHIPYRDSKLTRLLKDSLGGNTRTVFIATVSPSTSGIEETIQTLKFMERVKKVELHVHVNEEEDPSVVLQRYEREAQMMKAMMSKKTSKQVEELMARVEQLDKENLKLRGDLSRNQLWLYQEREARAKMEAVMKGAIANIVKAPDTSKPEMAAEAQHALLRSENVYLRGRVQELEAVNLDIEARIAELDEYQDRLADIRIFTRKIRDSRSRGSKASSEDDGEGGDDEEDVMEYSERIRFLEEAKAHAEAELTGNRRKFQAFLEQVQAALLDETEKVKELKKREAAFVKTTDELKRQLGERVASGAPLPARDEPRVTKQQLLALLEKESQLKDARNALCGMFSELDTLVQQLAEKVTTIPLSSSLPKVKAQIVQALEGAAENLQRLEDECNASINGPSLFAAPAAPAAAKSKKSKKGDSKTSSEELAKSTRSRSSSLSRRASTASASRSSDGDAPEPKPAAAAPRARHEAEEGAASDDTDASARRHAAATAGMPPAFSAPSAAPRPRSSGASAESKRVRKPLLSKPPPPPARTHNLPVNNTKTPLTPHQMRTKPEPDLARARGGEDIPPTSPTTTYNTALNSRSTRGAPSGGASSGAAPAKRPATAPTTAPGPSVSVGPEINWGSSKLSQKMGEARKLGALRSLNPMP